MDTTSRASRASSAACQPEPVPTSSTCSSPCSASSSHMRPTTSGWEIVCPAPIGSGSLSHARARSSGGTNRSAGQRRWRRARARRACVSGEPARRARRRRMRTLSATGRAGRAARQGAVRKRRRRRSARAGARGCGWGWGVGWTGGRRARGLRSGRARRPCGPTRRASCTSLGLAVEADDRRVEAEQALRVLDHQVLEHHVDARVLAGDLERAARGTWPASTPIDLLAPGLLAREVAELGEPQVERVAVRIDEPLAAREAVERVLERGRAPMLTLSAPGYARFGGRV